MESFTFEADVPGGPGAAQRARALVRHELGKWIPDGRLGDVALLVTELVSNGVRHGGAADGRPLHLRFTGRASALRVEVDDPGSRRGGVAPRRPDIGEGGGFGLHIVDRVASRWGVGDGPRTSVWFELDCR